jgi:hypothetical protein
MKKMIKKILMCISLLCAMPVAFSQGFYSMKQAVDAAYANDTTEDGPKAKVGRMANRWGGQFGLNGTFTQAAQNLNSFSGSINPNTRINQTGSCATVTPFWKEVGPVMDNNNATSYGHTGAGQMNRITFHPGYNGTSNRTIYALSRYGGMWVTYNDGDNWSRINTDPYIPFSSLGVLVIDPTNPARMYVTTGDPCGTESFLGYYATNEYPNFTLGIYGSNDGGLSWQTVNSGISSNLLANAGSIYNMAIDPTNNDNLIFTSTDGVYTCTNASGSLASISWTKDSNFASNFASDNKIIGLSFNATSNQWYVSGLNIYTTTNPFVTHTWQLATGATTGLDLTGNIYQNTGEVVARINMVNSPFHTNTVYAYLYLAADKLMIAKKTGTGSWQVIKYFTAYNFTRYQRGVDKMPLAVYPGNSDDLYIGSTSYYVYNSTTDVVDADYPFASGFHPDIHYLYIHPSQPDKLWAATDGGISVKDLTISGLLSGFTYKNQGIQSHLLWDLDDSESDKDFYLSALQDNGIVFKGGTLGNIWGTVPVISASSVGDGYESNIYDADPSEAYVAGNTSKLVKFNYNTGSSSSFPRSVITGHGSLNYFADPAYPGDRILIGDFNMVRSEDNGLTYDNFGGYLGFSIGTLNYNGNPANNLCGNKIFRTAHPVNYRQGVPFNVYALSQKQISAGTSTACPFPLFTRPSLILKSVTGYGKAIPGNEEFTNVAAITNALYDAALTAGAITAASAPYLSDIVCHPHNGDKVWVSSSDLLPGLKVWKTTNGGTTWTNADPTGVFSKIPVFCLVVARGSNDLVFAGTQDGVYYTDNTMGGVWCRYGASPSIQVFSLKINPCKNILLVGTYGRGAFEVNLPFMTNLVNIDVTGTSVIWNTPRNYPSSSIHVKSGTTLIIDNTTVGFGPDSRLYVEKGAKLIIRNNAVVTSASACNGYLWLGIELQGDQSQKQVITSGLDANHGYCIIETGGTVKNAHVGVKNFGSLNGDGESLDWANLGGGILQCSAAKFINCKLGTRFIPFSNKNVLNQPSNDLSYIMYSQFLTDAATASHHFEPEAHVSMWNTRGINLKANLFKNTTPSDYAIKKRGIGLVSHGASYNVVAPCTSFGTNGCATYGAPNIFENLYYGIDAGAALPTASMLVLGNSFVNNHRGMVLHGVDHAIANSNTFSIGSDYSESTLPNTAVTVSAPCGIYLNGCDAYTIQKNTFTNASGTGNALDFGIVNSYSNANPNELRMNYFNNIAVGIQAQDKNDRLQLKCNEFTANTMSTADVKVMGLQTAGSIDPQQGACITGDPTRLPGNEFSHTCSAAQDLAANAFVSGQVTYNTRLSSSNETPQTGCYNTSYYSINGCINAGSGDACPAIGPLVNGGGSTPAQLRINLSDSKSTVSSLRNGLLKGGRSQLFTTISSGNQLRLIDSFSVATPYLSDSVLMAFLKYKPTYGNGFIRTVLVTCSPLSPAVLAQFALTPVNGTTRDAVNAAQTGTSQRTYAERQLGYEQKMLVINYNNLIANLVNDRDNEARLDSLNKYLDYTIKPSSRAVKVGALIEQGLFTDALAQANAVEGNPDLKALLQNVVAVYSGTNAVVSYTGAVKVGIDSLKHKAPHNIGIKAQAFYNGIFGDAYGEVIYLSPQQEANASRKAREEEIPAKQTTEAGILVFPNPARNEVYFAIDLEAAQHLQMELYDIQGRLLVNESVENTKEFHKLDLANFAEGVYFYRVSGGTNYLKTGKIVVIK